MDKNITENYKEFLEGANRQKFQNRLQELVDTANRFIEEAGYSGYVECNERIMLNVLLDYWTDVERLQVFHNIERVRTEKIVAYTISWLIRRKPLQFVKFPPEERDIFVNERFAAYLMINECLSDDNKKYVPEQYQYKLDEYIDLVLYYFKYREVNPRVVELAIESFKMGLLVE